MTRKGPADSRCFLEGLRKKLIQRNIELLVQVLMVRTRMLVDCLKGQPVSKKRSNGIVGKPPLSTWGGKIES